METRQGFRVQSSAWRHWLLPWLGPIGMFAMLPFMGVSGGWWTGVMLVIYIGGIAFMIWRLRRCPKCSARIELRCVETETKGTWRKFHDCPHCRITWDPHIRIKD
jgi:hypothetical protein